MVGWKKLNSGFVEKGGPTVGDGWINAGVSLLSRDTILELPRGHSFSMERDIFPDLARRGRMAGLGQDAAFFDIGTPESYHEFTEFVRTSGIGRVP